VATEADGRVRPAHAENNDEATLKSFAEPDRVGRPGRDRQLASYNSESLGQRPHQAGHPDQTEGSRGRRPAGLPLDGVSSEALACPARMPAR